MTCISRTCSSAGRRRIETRSTARSTPASLICSARSSSCGPRVVATLGNFATKLLSGRSFGITRVHGQEHEVTLGSTSVMLYPLYHPAAALYTPSMLKALEDDFARLPELLRRGLETARATAAVGRRPRPADERPRPMAGRTRCSSASSEPVIERTTLSAAETEAFGGLLAACSGPATSSSCAASSEPGRRRSFAGPAGRSVSRGP